MKSFNASPSLCNYISINYIMKIFFTFFGFVERKKNLHCWLASIFELRLCWGKPLRRRLVQMVVGIHAVKIFYARLHRQRGSPLHSRAEFRQQCRRKAADHLEQQCCFLLFFYTTFLFFFFNTILKYPSCSRENRPPLAKIIACSYAKLRRRLAQWDPSWKFLMGSQHLQGLVANSYKK